MGAPKDSANTCSQSALMAERYERAILRLVRECRNQRRVFARLAGGQANTTEGPQQVNI